MLTTDLILERFNKKQKLVESRKQQSHSWVKGFLGMLYVAHANLARTEPYAQADILGNSRDIDVEERGVPLLVAAPPGWVNYMSLTDYDEEAEIAAELIGIQIGEGTTVPTPDDYALESRIIHSEHIPDVANIRGEYYLTQITPGEREIQGSAWYALEFQPTWPHELYRLRLKLYREGLPGTFTIGIRESLTGPDLVTYDLDGNTLTTDPAGEWKDIDFVTHPELQFCTPYYAVMRAPGGDSSNSVHVVCDADEVYAGGTNRYSNNSGANWSYHSGSGYSYCCLFEEFGRNEEKGVLYSGCEVYGLSFTHPNGQFSIRRYFHNASGASWTINEVGIYAMGTHSAGQCWAFLIARDTLGAPIVLADGEILRVTYVPQITV